MLPEVTQIDELLDQLAAVAVRVIDEQREELLSIVSHDLRNPLGTIELSATLLLTQLGEESPARPHLELIHGSAQRMDRLIGELLETDHPR